MFSEDLSGREMSGVFIIVYVMSVCFLCTPITFTKSCGLWGGALWVGWFVCFFVVMLLKTSVYLAENKVWFASYFYSYWKTEIQVAFRLPSSVLM